MQVLQSVNGGITSPAGIGTTLIDTREGSWLVLLPGWNCVTSGAYVPLPAVSVTDSAGNLWQQAAITVPGTAPTRCAVWVAPNAEAVAWVSAGLTGGAAAAAWTVAEITGMPQAAVLDFSVGTSGSGTALSLSWTAAGAGIGFALVAAGSAPVTIATPPSGWTSLGTATAGAGSAGTTVFPYYSQMGAGGGTTSLTLGSAAPFSYALCSLTASASPPPQQSQNFPLVIVEAAFGAQPGNISASADYLFSSEYVTWTDITARAIGPAVTSRIKCSRGRQYQLQQQETGTCAIPLSNVDGAFTPTAPGSPYYSNALNEDMSFQAGLGQWTPYHGLTLSSSTAFTYASAPGAVVQYSMLLTPPGATSAPGAFENVFMPVNPNYPYSGSFWVYCPAGWAGGMQCVMHWYSNPATSILNQTGPAVSIPAGQWTQVTMPDVTPAAGSRYMQFGLQAVGAPAGTTLFYVAEAAVVTGPATVQTGLVVPVTPIRVTAWWQGRRYPVWSGYAQQWPQEWPDMPQWGFSGLKAADALGVAAAGQMQSALIGEVLTDNPYAYLPCNETYTTAITGATPANPFVYPGGYFAPADANGLIAINRASGNQVTGTYADGTSQQVSTGLAMNFLGDSGTGMGASGYSAQVNGQRGPSMIYTDPGLPAVASSASPGGFTVEFWFNWDGTATSSSGAPAITLLTGYGPPSSYFASDVQDNGGLLLASIVGDSPNLPELEVAFGNSSGFLSTVTPSSLPQHCVIEILPGSPPTFTAWLNGQSMGAPQTFIPVVTLQALVLGPGRYSYDCATTIISNDGYAAQNYAAGHLAVYPYLLPQARITAHYEAGIAGWSGTDAATRFSQILTWGQLGLKRGGYNAASATGVPEITQIGPAYSLSGQSAAAAEFALAQSEGGSYRTQANGSLIYLERDIGYNQPVSATLADGTVTAPVILNTDPGFATGLAGWTATGGSVTYSPGNAYGTLGSLLISPSGTATASSPSFAYNGGTAAAGFWVNSPTGGTVTCGAVTSAGTASLALGLSAGAWEFAPVPVPAAAGVSSASLTVRGGTAPFYLAYAGMWYSPGNVPYNPKSSYGFDQTYIYNEAAATQQDGPNQLITYDNRGTASQAQYFRRSALTFSQQNVVSPYDVSDITTWSLAEYQQPSLHVSAVTVDAASNPLAAFPVVLSLDGGDTTLVNRSPVGGAPITETGTVERVQHDIGPGYWRTGYQLSPYGPGEAVLCADTAGFDTPATTTLGW